MKWSEVFDKYFIIPGNLERVLVFIPGSFDGEYINYGYTTVEETERGLDYNNISHLIYPTYSTKEVLGPFTHWEYIKQICSKERVIHKIKTMEERWNKFQELKKSTSPMDLTTLLDYDRTSVNNSW